MRVVAVLTASVLLALLTVGCVLPEQAAQYGHFEGYAGNSRNCTFCDDEQVTYRQSNPKAGVFAEPVAHYGLTVDNDGGPYACIVCHDGVTAKPAPYCTVECGFATPHSNLKEYPTRSKESSYAPVESLIGKGIRLFNGTVSCGSCHDLNKATKYHLSVDNSSSSLCFSCHII